jgi:xanthine/uracil/vitamin C permease (AzgA family)
MSAFVTVMMMPLTYSIAYGLIGGTLIFVCMEGTFWLLNKAGVAMPEYEEDIEDTETNSEELKESADKEADPEVVPKEEAQDMKA